MVRYLLHIQYLGTHFRGVPKVTPMERAAGHRAVEDVLIDTFSHFKLAEPVNVHVSSRTDAGVHAVCNTAHADLIYKEGKGPYDPEDILHSVNRNIREMGRTDIRLMACRPVPPTFHSQHRAQRRTYLYRIVSGCYHSTAPVTEFYRSWAVKERLDVAAMQEAANHFLGTHDFTTFRSTSPETWPKNPVKTVEVADVRRGALFIKEHDPFCRDLEAVELTFKSRSFIYRQVRRMTGLLVAIGKGQLQPTDVRPLLAARKIAAFPKTAQVAPAWGLYLCNVEYNEKDLVYD